MDSSNLKKVKEFLGEKSRRRRQRAVVTALAGIVVLSTAYVLSKPAQTLVKDTYCGMEEHVHLEDCYGQGLICGYEDAEEAPGGLGQSDSQESVSAEGGSQEGASPEIGSEEGGSQGSASGEGDPAGVLPEGDNSQEGSSGAGDLSGNASEGIGSAGDDSQKQDSAGDSAQEVSGPIMHQHSDSCYIEEKTLICGQEEDPGHVHTQDCETVSETRELTCGQEEREGHVHSDACMTVTETVELTCGQEEGEEHTHTEACGAVSQVTELTCGQEEDPGHAHTEVCETVSQVTELTCGQEEREGHAHLDACYETTRSLVCGQEEGSPESGGSLGSGSGDGGTEGTANGAGATESGSPEGTANGAGAAESGSPEGADNSAGAAESGSPEGTDNSAGAAESGSPEGTANGAGATESSLPEGTANGAGTSESGSPEGAGDGDLHVHTEECYGEVLLCRTEEHTHEEQCYEEVFCGIAGHVHGAACFDEDGELICLDAEHRHEAGCYKEPHCGITAHIHGGSCLVGDKNLVCETQEHVHVEECYIAATYFCTERIHTHDNDCYDLDGNLLCGSADYLIHSHDEACYDKNERLICPLPEVEEEEHIHGEECRGIYGVLICEKTETLRHVHAKTCRMEPEEIWVDTVGAAAYCGLSAHVHRAGCQDEKGEIVCGLEEHVHGDECFEEPGYGCAAGIHVHDGSCFAGDGSVRCGLADYVLHSHNEKCYGLNGKTVCGLPELLPHVHEDECYKIGAQEEEPELICPLPTVQEHRHEETCRDENGMLICGLPEVYGHEHTEECLIDASEVVVVKTYKGDDFFVSVSYNKKDANLPEQAQLYAERITAEDDAEYYAGRAAQYEEMQNGDGSIMQALLRIGFIADGAEVEPEAPVTVKVQLLDEKGLADGSAVTVVHFGQEGNRQLEGSEAKDNGTTFTLDSFSDIALGWTMPVRTIMLDKTFTYEDEAFAIRFHVEGEAVLPTEEEIQKAGGAVSDGTENGADSGSGGTEDPAGSEHEGAGEAPIGTDDGGGQAPAGNGAAGGMGNTVSGGDAIGGYAGEQAGESGTVTKEPQDIPDEGNVTNDDLEAVVVPLGEDAAQYEAVISYTQEIDAGEEILALQVLSYALTYRGAKLDLTGCRVTVEVKPAKALVEYAEEGQAQVMAIHEDGAPEDEESLGGDVSLVAVDVTLDEDSFTVGDIYDTLLVSQETADTFMTYETTAEGTDNTATVYASSQANPEFTVEYYANIDRVVTYDVAEVEGNGSSSAAGGNLKGYLSVIDTSKKSPDAPKNLPTNAKAEKGQVDRKYIRISEAGVVYTENELTEIYSSDRHSYVQAPGLAYFNKIAKNDNYVLQMIQVRRNGSDEWEEYSCAEGKEWHFTNKQSTKDKYKDKFILITNNATIRLVYGVKSETVSNGASFYDYDISDGKIYVDRNGVPVEGQRGEATFHDSGEKWYMYTWQQGINGNLPNQTFGFGNNNVKSGMGDKGSGNIASTNANTLPYGKATFGLVTGLEEGKLVYAPGVVAPNLFNEGEAHGKSSYAGQLIFDQKGDTYTLTGAEVKQGDKAVSNVSGLDRFGRQQINWNKTYYFASNDFYPLDNVHSAGAGGHDLKFGNLNAFNAVTVSNFGDKNKLSETLVMPKSDDEENHNHYFGMHYTISFDLVKDYVGPLEYLFYGDDDMWVFLDGPGCSGELICDIGGVHSSVGEYVNLWDYIDKGSEEAEGRYTLTFFYTERGASGSTCWMQFTLPSVSFATVEQDTGKLKIEKQVVGNVTDEEFGFEINFYKDDVQTEDNVLMNDYSYTKYDSDGNVVKSDVLIWDSSKFTLKAGEYIIVSFLPEGASYAIREVGPVTVKPTKPGEDVDWTVDSENPYTPEVVGGAAGGEPGVIIGSITKNDTVQIKYNNIYRFALPETGGSGTLAAYALAGAMGIMFGAGLMYRKKAEKGRGER